ncbi:MAG: carbohydrate ABC transporter permease [Oscillospiraceae bacterium]|jgi:multiple sugar transport system permease protein|nr:carbohydrate ABC transporter permease [Oscillospiraceae bacterium]
MQKNNIKRKSPVSGFLDKIFYNKYKKKREGAIRFYDMSSPLVKIACAAIFLICAAMIIVAVFPAAWAILAGFKDLKEFVTGKKILPVSFSFAGYAKTWESMKFARYYLNSAIAVAGGVVCAVLFNGLLAYVLGILRPVGHKVVFALVMWTLLIPPTTSVVAQFVNIHKVVEFFNKLAGLDSMNSFFNVMPLWLIMGANAFWLVLFKEFFESLPKDYTEAAQLDGCTDLGVFTKIMLPLSMPIVVVVSIFAVTAAWSDFLLPNLLLSNSEWRTVMVRLFEFRTAIKVTEIDKLHAVVFSIIPPTIMFILFQRQITRGVTVGGIKG